MSAVRELPKSAFRTISRPIYLVKVSKEKNTRSLSSELFPETCLPPRHTKPELQPDIRFRKAHNSDLITALATSFKCMRDMYGQFKEKITSRISLGIFKVHVFFNSLFCSASSYLCQEMVRSESSAHVHNHDTMVRVQKASPAPYYPNPPTLTKARLRIKVFARVLILRKSFDLCPGMCSVSIINQVVKPADVPDVCDSNALWAKQNQ